MTSVEHVDVLIVGAGLSGIGAAAQLRRRHPGRSLAILESRDATGGTWDLFRYPGIRSDSDMFTFGFRWRPWRGDRALADGPSILAYLRAVAAEHGVDRLVRHQHRVTGAAWDSGTARWTVEIDRDGEPVTMTASFLWSCTGYYDYERPHEPQLPGIERYAGQVVHPQHWPEDLDHTGKRVVVIGSGATAVTLVPAMAEHAEHVTMLQRSPSYVLAMPGRDPVARALRRLPARVADPVVRWKNILMTSASYRLARRRPALARRVLRAGAVKQLPEGYDVDTHFNPRYDPWDQRLCLVPDGDLFRVLSDGSASVVTDTIDTFTERGIRLASGTELEADLVVTATGLRLLPFGGIDLTVDGATVKLPETMSYQALMLSDVPNFAYTIGYTNASWTLKADLVADYVCRLLAHLDDHGLRVAVPRKDPTVADRPFLDFSSTYVLRALDELPRQGDRAPWALRQNYLADRRTIRKAPIDDGVLELG